MTVCSVASEGEMYALITCFSPAVRSITASLRTMEETGTVLSFLVHPEKITADVKAARNIKRNCFITISYSVCAKIMIVVKN